MGVGFSRFLLFQSNNNNNNRQALITTSNRHEQQQQSQSQRTSAWWQKLFNFNQRHNKTTDRNHTNDELTATNTEANRSKMSARRCLAFCDIAVRLASAGKRRRSAIIHSLHLSPRAVANIHRFNPENAFRNPSLPADPQPGIVSSTTPGTARRRKQVTFAPVVEMRFFRTQC